MTPGADGKSWRYSFPASRLRSSYFGTTIKATVNFNTPGLLSAFILLLLTILFATGIIELPAGMGSGPFGVWLRLADFAKAVVSFSLIFVWTPVGMVLTPDTPMGVTLLLAPDAVFLLAALIYLSNSFSGSAK